MDVVEVVLLVLVALVGTFDVPSDKMCISNKTKDMNIKVFNRI